MRRLLERLGISAVLVAVLGAGLVALAAPARAADDYPYRNEDPSELDPYGFYYRNCTSFVAWRMSQRGPFDNYMRGGHWHHARNWADNAARIGFQVDETPAPGAIAHWYAGEAGAGSLGHVAFVSSVHPDGSVTVEDYNATSPYAYSARGPTRAPRYIHVYDDAAAAPAPAPAQSEPEAPAERTEAAVAAPQAVPVRASPPLSQPEIEPVPVGQLTAPAADEKIRPGQVVRVRGDFKDDDSVAKVHFFAADEKYQWSMIGTDAHGGDGEYAVSWKVDYPHGAVVSIYAEAFDESGSHAVDSIRGIEGIRVVDDRGARPGPARGTSDRVSATGVGDEPVKARGHTRGTVLGPIVVILPIVAAIAVSIGFGRRRMRRRARRLETLLG